MSDLTCTLCGALVPISVFASHARVDHGMALEVATWPDGGPVVVDRTVTALEAAGVTFTGSCGRHGLAFTRYADYVAHINGPDHAGDPVVRDLDRALYDLADPYDDSDRIDGWDGGPE